MVLRRKSMKPQCWLVLIFQTFFIFYFTSEHTIAGVLLQKNGENLEHIISFFNIELRDFEFKYNIMENKYYALVKSLKYFRVYISHSHVISFVPNNVVKEILT